MGKRRGRKPKYHPRPPEPPVPPPPPKKSFWRLVPRWIWIWIVAFSVLITLAEAFPWLSVQNGRILDPRNPYSELFTLKNEGYVPVTDLTAICMMSFTDTHENGFSDTKVTYPNFAKYMPHAASATIPCFRSVRDSVKDG